MLFLCVALMLHTCYSYAILQMIDVYDHTWRTADEQGYTGWMTFSSNLTVAVGNSDDFSTWNMSNTDHILNIYNSAGALTVKLVGAFQDKLQKWRLKGPYQFAATKGLTPGSNLYFEQMVW